MIHSGTVSGGVSSALSCRMHSDFLPVPKGLFQATGKFEGVSADQQLRHWKSTTSTRLPGKGQREPHAF
eukprot:2736867-Amphidinium_carterae.3